MLIQIGANTFLGRISSRELVLFFCHPETVWGIEEQDGEALTSTASFSGVVGERAANGSLISLFITHARAEDARVTCVNEIVNVVLSETDQPTSTLEVMPGILLTHTVDGGVVCVAADTRDDHTREW